jgi:flavin-dependent dehydrogenase
MTAVAAYPVAIVGGGPAGCATALALRRRGIGGVLVVEGGDYAAVRIGESIPPDTRLLLEQLGVWADFVEEGHEPCLGSCSSWGDDALGYNDFLYNPHGTGWHLDRRRFDAFLARKAVESGATLWTGTRLVGARRVEGDGFEVHLARGEGSPRTARARVVVDATGSGSRLARLMGARQRLHDRLTCLTAFLEMPAGSEFPRLTMLEAVEYGWWYAARLPGRVVAVAVASDAAIVKALRLQTADGWLGRLRRTTHVAGELDGCDLVGGGLVARTAPSFVLDMVGGDGWLAVGDAASAYDPISSQGMYTALLDGLEAADAIAAYLTGDAGGLERYRAAVEARFDGYLQLRAYLYGLERRWPASAFWRRRLERAADPGRDPGPAAQKARVR